MEILLWGMAVFSGYTLIFIAGNQEIPTGSRGSRRVIGVMAGVVSAMVAVAVGGSATSYFSEALVLLLAAAGFIYFLYYFDSNRRARISWFIFYGLCSVIATVSIYGLWTGEKVTFYGYLIAGLLMSGILYLVNLLAKTDKVVCGQNTAFLLGVYSVFLLLSSLREYGDLHHDSLAVSFETPGSVSLWPLGALLILAFVAGLFFNTKNKTSC